LNRAYSAPTLVQTPSQLTLLYVCYYSRHDCHLHAFIPLPFVPSGAYFME